MRFTFQDTNWQQYSSSEQPNLRSYFDLIDPASVILGSDTYWTCTVPFYSPAIRLACLSYQDNLGSEQRIYFLKHLSHTEEKGSFHTLNGIAVPIHVTNDRDLICLNLETAIDYLRFFCFFVHGEEGAFYVLNNNEDERISQKIWADLVDHHAVTGENPCHLNSAPCIRTEMVDDKEIFYVSALIYYGNSINICDFYIHPDGEIGIADNKALLINLPDKINVQLIPWNNSM